MIHAKLSNQMGGEAVKRIPIKTNTGRLPGLLYNNLETTYDYYEKKLQTERLVVGIPSVKETGY